MHLHKNTNQTQNQMAKLLYLVAWCGRSLHEPVPPELDPFSSSARTCEVVEWVCACMGLCEHDNREEQEKPIVNLHGCVCSQRQEQKREARKNKKNGATTRRKKRRSETRKQAKPNHQIVLHAPVSFFLSFSFLLPSIRRRRPSPKTPLQGCCCCCLRDARALPGCLLPRTKK